MNWAEKKKVSNKHDVYTEHMKVYYDESDQLLSNNERRTCGSHNFECFTENQKTDVFKYSFFPTSI